MINTYFALDTNSPHCRMALHHLELLFSYEGTHYAEPHGRSVLTAVLPLITALQELEYQCFNISLT